MADDEHDVYLTTSLEYLEEQAEALAASGDNEALLELIATVRRHTTAMKEQLRELGVHELGERAHALAERADALERRERELREAEEALAARRAEADAQARAVFAQAREHAESVAAIEAALAARAEEVEAAEAQLAEREGAVGAHEAALAARRDEVDERARELEPSAPAPEPAHLLFVPGPDGYELVGREGPCPRRGETVLLGERRFLVVKVARSPLPGDLRHCAFIV